MSPRLQQVAKKDRGRRGQCNDEHDDSRFRAISQCAPRSGPHRRTGPVWMGAPGIAV